METVKPFLSSSHQGQTVCKSIVIPDIVVLVNNLFYLIWEYSIGLVLLVCFFFFLVNYGIIFFLACIFKLKWTVLLFFFSLRGRIQTFTLELLRLSSWVSQQRSGEESPPRHNREGLETQGAGRVFSKTLWLWGLNLNLKPFRAKFQ